MEVTTNNYNITNKNLIVHLRFVAIIFQGPVSASCTESRLKILIFTFPKKSSLRSMAVLSSRAHEKNKNRLSGFVAFSTAAPSTHFDILLTTCLVSVFPANQK